MTVTLKQKEGECWQCCCIRHGAQHTNGPCSCTPEFREQRRREHDFLRKLAEESQLLGLYDIGGEGGGA